MSPKPSLVRKAGRGHGPSVAGRMVDRKVVCKTAELLKLGHSTEVGVRLVRCHTESNRTCSAASSTVSSRRPYPPSERRAKVPVHVAPSVGHRQ